MKPRRISIAIAGTILLASFAGGLISQRPYDEQYREAIDAPASSRFWLGTDALGRDRWSRLVYGTRVSMLLALSAAGLSVAVALAAGAGAGFLGGFWNSALLSVADLFLCVPAFFLLTAVRAALPLNAGPMLSVALTFGLLGLLGWAGPARVLSLRTRQITQSDYIRQALAQGLSPGRVLLCHIIPNLKPILVAQFWILVPAYIIAEANLGVLGLGVSDPMPSWGSLLRELESPNSWGSLRLILPLLLLGVVSAALQFGFRKQPDER